MNETTDNNDELSIEQLSTVIAGTDIDHARKMALDNPTIYREKMIDGITDDTIDENEKYEENEESHGKKL